MSNTRSNGKMSVQSMRWLARLVSIPWAYWAAFWTFFVLANFSGEGHLSSAIVALVLIITLPLFFGAAIIASVWGKEAFGGTLLLADGALILAGIIVAAFLTGEPVNFLIILGILGATTMVLPPWLAGYLFRECHRRSQEPAE